MFACGIRQSVVLCLAAFLLVPSGEVLAERIDFQIDSIEVQAGSSASVLVVIRENTTNLAGYSLNVDVVGVGDALGDVVVDVGASNFFPSRNLIVQDADDGLDPVFSVISDPGDGGVFFNAQSLSGETVELAQPGFSDVLGELILDVSPDALGRFTLSLGPGTVLFDGLDGVAFDTQALEISVVPEPATVLWLMVCLVLRRRGG